MDKKVGWLVACKKTSPRRRVVFLDSSTPGHDLGRAAPAADAAALHHPPGGRPRRGPALRDPGGLQAGPERGGCHALSIGKIQN